MSAPVLNAVLRHPRRLGFVAFNLVVLSLGALWRTAPPEAGLADLPNYALANVGMAFVLLAWVVAWVAWVLMVLRRWRRRQAGAGS